ncbi:hypothetical protein BVRB_034730, partial [Beta vulgaris subsp. vulgaris]
NQDLDARDLTNRSTTPQQMKLIRLQLWNKREIKV